MLQRLLARIAHLNLTGKIRDVSPVMKAYGGYSDIFTGYCSVVTSDGNGILKVAIKRLRVHTMGDEKFQKKLVKELYIWTKLDHPYILPLHGFLFEDDNYPSLVSAWMENGTVLTYLGSHPDCDLRQLVRRIAKGIGYLHNNGIVHSDIKPISENILISSSGEPRICDFGISRVLAASKTFSFGSTTGGIGGTIRYTSIELLYPMDQQSDIYSKASDVWAFGMTVLVLLTKKPPYFHIKNDVGIVSAIMFGELPTIPEEYSNTWSDLYRYLWKLCNLCWARSPSARPSMSTIALKLRTIRHPQTAWDTRTPAPMNERPTHQVAGHFAPWLSARYQLWTNDLPITLPFATNAYDRGFDSPLARPSLPNLAEITKESLELPKKRIKRDHNDRCGFCTHFNQTVGLLL
ncbi:hypothetical protein M0805_002785 [Coniferiporia weirii]|nr:hypothetical protein M0805_002785 [Coniferiporia weirii]